jgi:GNAT superfamily N-acetyltransferase
VTKQGFFVLRKVVMQNPHSSYTIRPAVEADAAAIVKVHSRSWIETYPNEAAGVSLAWVQARVDQWNTPEGLEWRKARIRDTTNRAMRVAENEDGMIIGLVSSIRDNDMQRLNALYVDKAYYGSGVAQQLMDWLIGWADPHRPLDLEVASYNERAKAFYRKYGFIEVEHSEHIVHEVIPVITMIRKGDKQ